MLSAFCAHVEAAFGEVEAVLVVADFLPYLRRKASEQVSELAPIASLILYAAWLEHWTNMVVSVAKLRCGDTSGQVEDYFASQPRYEDKVRLIGNDLGLQELPKKLFDWIMQVMKTRNQYLHYTWSGRTERKMYRDVQGVAALVRKGEVMLDALSQYERQNFDAPFAEVGRQIFHAAR